MTQYTVAVCQVAAPLVGHQFDLLTVKDLFDVFVSRRADDDRPACAFLQNLADLSGIAQRGEFLAIASAHISQHGHPGMDANAVEQPLVFRQFFVQGEQVIEQAHPGAHRTDRKSTRLNSSHVKISYAVFCLKKKKNTKRT